MGISGSTLEAKALSVDCLFLLDPFHVQSQGNLSLGRAKDIPRRPSGLWQLEALRPTLLPPWANPQSHSGKGTQGENKLTSYLFRAKSSNTRGATRCKLKERAPFYIYFQFKR